jgi:curved DNA-binding protein CbpA
MSGRREPAADLYRLLSVSRGASAAAIARAYRRQARALHPDSRPDDAGATDRFRAVTEAYQVLSDPRRRAAYDRDLRARSGTGRPVAPGHAASPPAAPPLYPLGPARITATPGGDPRDPGAPGPGRPPAASRIPAPLWADRELTEALWLLARYRSRGWPW